MEGFITAIANRADEWLQKAREKYLGMEVIERIDQSNEEIERTRQMNMGILQCVVHQLLGNDPDTLGLTLGAQMVTSRQDSQHYPIFVSYSSDDEPIVTPVVRLIRITAANAFQDKDSIELGRKWREVICAAIEEAALIVVFWSKNSASSKNVRAEWVQGIELNKRIVPVLLDSTPLDSSLAQFQYLDLRPLSVAGMTRVGEDGELQEVLKTKFGAADSADAAAQLLTFLERCSISP